MIGATKRHFETCASTNDLAAAWARDKHNPAPDGGVVVANSQDAGRGRQGRSWHSPPGENLYFSCVLRPQLPASKVPPITLCAGLAVCEIVNTLGVAASIKWPNDVLVGRNKLAGVLTEMSTRSQNVDAVIVGIGLNVNTLEFPADLEATSIRQQTGKTHDRSAVLDKILQAMDVWIQRYCAHGVTVLAKAFEQHSLLTNKEVSVKIAGALVVGRVVSLAEDGSLLVQDRTGTTHKVIAGEVRLLNSEEKEGVEQ